MGFEMEVFLTNADAMEVWQLTEAVMEVCQPKEAVIGASYDNGLPGEMGSKRCVPDDDRTGREGLPGFLPPDLPNSPKLGEGYRAKALHLLDARHRQPLLFGVSSGLAISRNKR